MNRIYILNIVIQIVTEYLDIIGKPANITEETALMGSDAVLDSIGLVTIVVDIEGRLMENDINVSLTSEKAMSLRKSPFRNIGALTDYIVTQNEETNNGK